MYLLHMCYESYLITASYFVTVSVLRIGNTIIRSSTRIVMASDTNLKFKASIEHYEDSDTQPVIRVDLEETGDTPTLPPMYIKEAFIEDNGQNFVKINNLRVHNDQRYVPLSNSESSFDDRSSTNRSVCCQDAEVSENAVNDGVKPEVRIHSPKERIKVNMGGDIFYIRRANLKRAPETKLANLSESDFEFDEEADEYFFDRGSSLFPYIISFYNTGELHFNHCLCARKVQRELQFWNISENYLSECCFQRVKDDEYIAALHASIKTHLNSKSRYISAVDSSSEQNGYETWKMKVFKFLDDPFSSKGSRVSIHQ